MIASSKNDFHENDLIPIIISEAIYVHNKLGPGFLESAYKECLKHRLIKAGLYVEKEIPIPIVFDEIKLECGYRADFPINRKIILEIKSVDCLIDKHVAQTLSYLKFGNFKLGLLINFNVLRLKDGLRRVVNGL